MSSIYSIGCFIGAMSTISTGDSLDLLPQILRGLAVKGIGAIMQACGWTVASMMVGRIVTSLGTEMNTATAGARQAESSEVNSR